MPPQPPPASAAPSRPDAASAEARLQAILAGEAFVSHLAEVTGRPAEDVRRMLAAEAADPGSTVAAAVWAFGVEPYVYSPAMERFYGQSDAFLFELAVWNRQGFKRSMRQWTRRKLDAEAERLGRPLRVLAFGEGIGIDAASAALGGHAVTYFEVPGLSERLARRVFAEAGVAVEAVTDLAALAGRRFDAITCFDVLEHVPNPRELLGTLVGLLGDGGLLFVHAPFYLILPAYPTHLRANRRYAGRMNLYERAGLSLLDGQIAWNPLLFRKGGDAGAASSVKRGLLRAGGLALQVGRKTSLPFRPLHALLRR